ncbi:MAG: hypothetical protein FJZ96_01170 [Chloroflexi bacterium]|nr:hypothetical protein [Chloroflexota bacterium]
MKNARTIVWMIVLALLAGCSLSTGVNGNNNPLPTGEVYITPAPSVEAAITAYLEAWLAGDYAAMHAMLAQANRDTISVEEFGGRHRDALLAMNVSSFEYSILSTLTNPNTAQAAYRITYHTSILGDIQRDIVVNLSREQDAWRVQWDTALILPEMAGGKKLATDYRSPARGDIYDRNGQPVVVQADAVALGVVPGQILLDQENLLLSELWKLTGYRPETIRSWYAFAQPDWYIPVGETTAEELAASYEALSALGGLRMTPYTSRYHYDNGIASQSVGYVLAIPPEDVEAYRSLGYSGNERVGSTGIEKWGEPYLAGRNGASLYVTDPDGAILTRIVATDPTPASSLTLTIDKELQQQAQAAMSNLAGAAVVIEVDTGRVLAIVSSPTYDPNIFNPDNINYAGLTNLLSAPNNPLYNRATQGEYPPGSVFKIVTMAAALESGVYTAASAYDCQYTFTELSDRTLYDWTWDHCQEEKLLSGKETCDTQPSSVTLGGPLTLPQGLMRSCNPWFYHIGLDLFNQGMTTAITDMATGFGLGHATGLEQVAETEGNNPYPRDGVEATSLAIGQGEMQTSPLQVAVFTAAIANGGTLYRPQLVERVQPVYGDPLLSFAPQANGELPLSAENLTAIQNAMKSVTSNSRGTAYTPMRGLTIPVAGKTGTAETSVPGSPHSWFTGYTLANREDKPDIAVVVLVEYAGEGSEYAAPIFRRIVESYFFGRPQTVYWWESTIGVTRTPTPEGLETLTPTP